MGNYFSKNENNYMEFDFKNYSKISIFSLEEVKLIYYQYNYYSKIDIDDGTIDYKEFLKILKIKDSIFSKQLFKLFDENEDNKINFREYLLGLSFMWEENFDKQVNVLFNLINIKNRDYLTFEDMFIFIKDSLSNYNNINIKDEILKKNIINSLEISLNYIKPKKDIKQENTNNLLFENIYFIDDKKMADINKNKDNFNNLIIDIELFSYFVRINEQFTKWISIDFEKLKANFKYLLNNL